MTSGVDVERTLMRLRGLWKSLLSKNERSLFVERKLCRTQMVRFLQGHLANPCEKARFLALDLLCGTVPRLDDKTDELLRDVAVLDERLLGRSASKDVRMKVFHFLRAFSRRTNDLGSFVEKFCRLGLETDAIRIACIHGSCIIFDEDVGDRLYALLVPGLAGLLERHRAHPSVLRSTYRTLRRIHETVGDDRFAGLVRDVGREAIGLYRGFFNFEEEDPYLNHDLADCSDLIAEYRKKMAKVHLVKAFDVVEPVFLERISASKDCQRAVEVANFALALKRASWNEATLEPHVLDLIKMAASFLADHNRTIHMSGLDILKEIIARMGFHLAPHLANLACILREALASPNSKIAAKTERVTHRLLRSVHPMTVVWELLRDWEPRHKEPVLKLVCGELKCFPYSDFDLASLCISVAREMDDADDRVRASSRECVRLLLSVMLASPVPSARDRAARMMLADPALRRETLRCVGVSEEGSLNDSSEDSGTNTAPSTAWSPSGSTSTLVSDSTVRSIRRFPDQIRRQNTTGRSARSSHLFTARTPADMRPTAAVLSLESLQGEESPLFSTETIHSRVAVKLGDIPRATKSSVLTPERSALSRKAYSSNHQRDDKFRPERNVASKNCESVPNFKKNETVKQGSNKMSVQEQQFYKSISQRFDFEDEEQDRVILPSPIFTETRDPSSPRNGDQREALLSSAGPSFASSTPRRRWRWTPRMDDHLAGGDTSKLQMNAGVVEPWIGGGGGEEAGGDPRAEETLLQSGDCCTLVSMSSDTLLDHALDEVNSSSGFQVRSLDPKKYNFNILRIFTPKTAESVQELDDYETREDLSISSPTLVTTPGGSMEFTISGSSRLETTPQKNKKSSRNEQASQKDVTQPKTFESKRCSNLNKDKICKATSSSKSKYNECGDTSRKRVSSGETSCTSSTLERDPMPFQQMPSPLPSKERSDGLSTTKKCDSTSEIGSEHRNGDARKPFLTTEEATGTPSSTCQVSSPLQPFHPEYDKPAHVSASASDATPVESVDGSLDEHVGEMDEHGDKSDTRSGDAPSSDVGRATERSVAAERRNSSAKKPSSGPSDEKGVLSTRPFLRKGSKKPSMRGGAWGRKESQRTAVVQEGELAGKQANRPEEEDSKKMPTTRTVKRVVAREKKSFLSKAAEDDVDPVGPEESSETAPPPLPEERFGRCPWRRDLEYASKGGTCGWARAFEEGVRRMRPFASQEAAEQEMRKALEELDGKAWQGKEEALGVVVRLALHHPDTLRAECARVVAGVCGEVRNFRQSVAGKAVLTAGCLYDAMGKKLENKLRAVVGALLTKSGNRTLSSYFRLVIKSLFRIVDASSPHKVALAFIHEGSRHPNKASRETAAQFLAVLTETMGPGNSLSGPLASHVLKSAAHFAFDCSPLTRYCGKRMLRVLTKHPNFEKLKDHHLDVGTAQNLSKVLESIGIRGVDEELLPINIIK